MYTLDMNKTTPACPKGESYKRFTKKHHGCDPVQRAYVRNNNKLIPIGWYCSVCKTIFNKDDLSTNWQQLVN